jgi:Rrf2 family protein
MKLTRASIYAIHAVAFMAAQKQNLSVPSHQIAKARGIPERFLLKVLKPLVSARVLVSMKGPNGGYRLARAATQITMLEIIEAVDGPLRGQVSFMAGKGEERLDRRLETICTQIVDQMRKQLQKVHIPDLTSKANK